MEVLFCSWTLIVPVLTWNVDTRIPLWFSGSKGSYFGYSVALHDNSNGAFALVSATRANSSFGPASLHQPGVLNRCDITTTKCKEVRLGTTANNVKSSNEDSLRPYEAKEDDMWLGVSLDVQSTGKGYILACGHLWKNQFHTGRYFTNGACHIIDREFKRSTYRVLLPFIDKYKQIFVSGIPYYSQSTAGISATFVEDENDVYILIGAPGTYDWLGTVASYSIPIRDRSYALSPVIPNTATWEDISPAAYVGYSVTAGRFVASNNVQFVTGAPRDSDNKGSVYIFKSPYRNGNNMTVLQRLQGEQIGEYFGACVVGVKINEDPYMSLFVGSPFYSLTGLGDEGKVNVYTSDGMVLQKHRELTGSKKPRSRFGSTIASVGDVNQDGFNDVAIGAPYEDEQGAIYIYHGSSMGLDEKYKQRIAAVDINPKLSGFGISISKGKDIDGNKYPDILVGSYASDNAVLLRTRPLVQVFATVLFDPPQIDANISRCIWNQNSVPCFNVTFCLLYKGNHLPDQIDISTELTSGRQRDGLQVRRYLEQDGTLTSYIRQDVRIIKGKSRCYNNHAYIVADPTDFINPIQITLNFKLTHEVTKEDSFCKSCPMLHPEFPSRINETITFQNGCGEDGVCSSDLNLTANVLGLSSGELVVGQDETIILSIELQNLEEPAYDTDLYIYVPPDAQIINQGNCENEEKFSDLPVITCRAGNPLVNGHKAKFEIKLDTSHVSTELDYLSIAINATTASQEANPADNYLVVEIPLKILADITIIGTSLSEQITVDKEHQEIASDITHLYTVLKSLPGPINSVAIDFLVPTNSRNVNFLQLNSININEGSLSTSVPATCNFTTDRPSFSTSLSTTPLPARKRRSVRGEEASFSPLSSEQSGHPSNYILDCITSTCTRISCTAGPFKGTNLALSFRIYGTLNNTYLKTILDQQDRIKIVTEGRVRIKDKRVNIQPINHRPDEAAVFTTVQPAIFLPEQNVAIWIIILSIVAGLLLLVLISLVLVKVGFFRRKKIENLEKAMLGAEMERMDKSVSADSETDCR